MSHAPISTTRATCTEPRCKVVSGNHPDVLRLAPAPGSTAALRQAAGGRPISWRYEADGPSADHWSVLRKQLKRTPGEGAPQASTSLARGASLEGPGAASFRAKKRTRTSTPLRALVPETSASAIPPSSRGLIGFGGRSVHRTSSPRKDHFASSLRQHPLRGDADEVERWCYEPAPRCPRQS